MAGDASDAGTSVLDLITSALLPNGLDALAGGRSDASGYRHRRQRRVCHIPSERFRQLGGVRFAA